MPLLSAQRKIKKYKYLVIGDLCPDFVLKDYIDKQSDAFTILAPGRSLDASYQILLHTISILDEDGICVIIDSGRHPNQVYTVFDVPYLNLVTRKELQIESLFRKASYPLFYEPVKSLFILFNLAFINHKCKKMICIDERFVNLFQQRRNRLVYLSLKIGKVRGSYRFAQGVRRSYRFAQGVKGQYLWQVIAGPTIGL